MTTATVNDVHQHAPSKASLKAWWNHFAFAQRAKRDADEKRATAVPPQGPVFGRPLRESLQRASVQISTAGNNGELFVWGHIPVVVAKCGLYLKENATEHAGIFRVSGSSKRMRDLQAAFETPPRYGKDLDWKKQQFTPHDVASVFRRFLTQMPEPVVPHELYHPFRDTLAKKPFNRDEAITRYKRLIRSLQDDNRFLLLYVLDLLSVFARKSDKNLMTAKNLAVIFRPALLSHPSHELSPPEHQLSQDVLEFLIEHQDWFMLDIAPPSGAPAGTPPVEPVDMIISDEDWSTDGGRRVTRRRTTSERPSDVAGRMRGEAENLSPVLETPPSRGESVVTVSRSRTMPSRHSRGRSGNASSSTDDESHPKLLKKQKRTSAQAQSRPGAVG
ncbi:hypothetical protein PHLGIDRAFT_101163 [Phlebiopsis gigantea 11061_1 CR5-6]|uniref:Rho-GAP domain-containing protein n=1 Tax=Phlebiopsis gigantea (strain 11061_1 CR5-6) TaxID=745531 RepID=A0A0C3SEH0_PHLG1|nr:hypothetical protein PHLGIDRAFT_101163 [Phlebiopsis gigantea 11061_1 CR5-6]